MADYYKDERPGAGGGSGVGGGSWNTPGGGTGVKPGWGGNGGNGTKGWWWLWGGGAGAPYLKVSPEGYLLIDQTPHLLTGSGQCRPIPSLLVYLDGAEQHKHAGCVLCKLSDSRSLIIRRASVGASSLFSVAGYVSPISLGTFKLSVRWQGGHYDYSKMSRMAFRVFGVTIQARKISLSGWNDVATIIIKENNTIYVNGIKGSIRGNSRFLDA